jgi:acetyl esterase/lipase
MPQDLALDGAPLCVGNVAPLASAIPEILDYVDPELRNAARLFLALPASSGDELAVLRAGGTAPELIWMTDVPVSERSIAGRGGAEVLLYIVNAKPGTMRPGIVHMHGGGFVTGSAKSDIPALQRMARERITSAR